MLTTDQIESWNVIYDDSGLTAELLDNEAVALYAEGSHKLTMTVREWRLINAALAAMEVAS